MQFRSRFLWLPTNCIATSCHAMIFTNSPLPVEMSVSVLGPDEYQMGSKVRCKQSTGKIPETAVMSWQRTASSTRLEYHLLFGRSAPKRFARSKPGRREWSSREIWLPLRRLGYCTSLLPVSSIPGSIRA
ncbi:hypothetical protein BDW69DRAFT_143189 [Aspergillus filifer]